MVSGHDALTRLLLSYEADALARTSSERTPYDLARSARNSTVMEILEEHTEVEQGPDVQMVRKSNDRMEDSVLAEGCCSSGA